MHDFTHRIAPDWKQQLLAVLERAKAHGAKGLMVFDLDSTVFDNRPRQSRIVREYGAAAGVAELTRCQPSHWVSGWDLEAAMVACGLTAEAARGHFKPAKAFWGARFFTSAYCVDDVPEPGAVEYLRRTLETGAQLVYVTGRHEAMREGSVACMARHGMPTPGGTVKLLMKPTAAESDDQYKRETHAALQGMGAVVAAFDNEPTHVNDYALTFPSATAIHLATDHSGRPVELHPRVISVPDFALDRA